MNSKRKKTPNWEHKKFRFETLNSRFFANRFWPLPLSTLTPWCSYRAHLWCRPGGGAGEVWISLLIYLVLPWFLLYLPEISWNFLIMLFSISLTNTWSCFFSTSSGNCIYRLSCKVQISITFEGILLNFKFKKGCLRYYPRYPSVNFQ